MNLKEVYEIFYPGKCGKLPSVWKVPPKYRSKKEFFEELLPIEIRWLNYKIWNDKARRSRFLSDCKKEARYIAALRTYLFEHPWTISRIEGKAKTLLSGQISEECMNDRFLQIIDEEEVEISRNLRKYLFDTEANRLKTKWENVLTFYVLLAIFPKEINQIYVQYIYNREHNIHFKEEEDSNSSTEKDGILFQYEYPPDMGIVSPGEIINHTWVMKNVGNILWENRYYECNQSVIELDEKNRILHLPQIVYPGDKVSPSVSFYAPETPGTYVMNWKMKDGNGNEAFPDRLGLGLHFMVLDLEDEKVSRVKNGGNYKVIEEIPRHPVTSISGKLHSHTWIIENTGTTIWNEYYLECINGDNFSYAKRELCVPFKKRVMPGERISVKVEFATPPIEGIYFMVSGNCHCRRFSRFYINRFYAFCIQSNGNSLLVAAEICHAFHRNTFRKNRYLQGRLSSPCFCHAFCFCFQRHFPLFIIFSRFIHCLLEIDQFLIYFDQSVTHSIR